MYIFPGPLPKKSQKIIKKIRMQSYGAQSKWIYLQLSPTSKAQGTLWRREQKDFKSQKISEFAVRLSLRNARMN